MSDSSDNSSSSESSEEDEKKKSKKDKKKDKKKGKKDKKKDKKDPYSQNSREKARLEAQQRLMGIDTSKPKKKKKKSKNSSSSSSDSEQQLKRIRNAVEAHDDSFEKKWAEDSEKVPEPEPEKPYDEMTWPERAAAAAMKAEAAAIWAGASKQKSMEAAEEAGEAVMRRAEQFGYVEPLKERAKFNAAKPTSKPKMSPVEQARSAGMHGVAMHAGGKGAPKGGKAVFGMGAPMGERSSGYM
ncbi:unnamed protein product [Polarella glacialis]|uniref:Uncharacterized protein n=1 Tax=Polarella glacialis TaxID=89957 RepID=A0A813EUW0_POLGL|nr:unnamed protein product [Polarella glacialis]